MEIAQNLNLLIVGCGFFTLEIGIGLHWSLPIALIVGGALLMVGGAWPYLVQPLRKRNL